MSHSSGAVLFKDGTIKYYEYNGTVDVCQPKLFSTREELSANWRTHDWPLCNNSNHNHERVKIYSSYGYGFEWEGFACKDCMILISPLEPNHDTMIDYDRNDKPDWLK